MIDLKIVKGLKMKFFDFGAFIKIMQLLSHAKIIFRMLFGAFHLTPERHFQIRFFTNIHGFQQHPSPTLDQPQLYVYR